MSLIRKSSDIAVVGIESSKMNLCLKHVCPSNDVVVDSGHTVRFHVESADGLSEQTFQLSSVMVKAPVTKPVVLCLASLILLSSSQNLIGV